MNQLYYDHIQTPVGTMQIIANDKIVLAIEFSETLENARANSITDLSKNQLLDYFAGTRKVFDLPVAANGVAQGTHFQQTVWQALNTVNYGQTCCYADIANKINNPKAVRAVGLANGKNPLTIVVPCHRVIGKNGSLTGYASGVERKSWLLEHELRNLAS